MPLTFHTTLIANYDDVGRKPTTKHVGATSQTAEGVAVGHKNEAHVCAAQVTSEQGNAEEDTDNGGFGVQNPCKLNKNVHDVNDQQPDQQGDEAFPANRPVVDVGRNATAAREDKLDSTTDPYVSLWDRACASIQERDPISKHVGNRQSLVTKFVLINL